MITRTPRKQNTQAACARIRLRSFFFVANVARDGAVRRYDGQAHPHASSSTQFCAVLYRTCFWQRLQHRNSAAHRRGYAAGKSLRAA